MDVRPTTNRPDGDGDTDGAHVTAEVKVLTLNSVSAGEEEQ
jgi:hypothetical protein